MVVRILHGARSLGAYKGHFFTDKSSFRVVLTLSVLERGSRLSPVNLASAESGLLARPADSPREGGSHVLCGLLARIMQEP